MLLLERQESIATHRQQTPVSGANAGVIEEARRRQRRHRATGAAVLVAAALAAVLGFAGGAGPTRARLPARSSAPLDWLTGVPLSPDTHLRLLVAGSDGPASIVDVDNGSVRVLHLGPLTHRSVWGPTLTLYALTGSSGAALAVVTRQPCGRCAIAQEQFSIATSGAVKQIATRYFAQPTTQTTQVPGSASEWVLTRGGTGRCSLRLVPSPHPAVAVPCGDVGPAFPDGLALWTENDQRGIVLNPYTGVVRDHLRAAYEFQPVGHNLAIESSPELNPAALSLVNLATGHRLRLGWPSILHFGYQVLPEPHGPLVAIQFADPAYPPPPQQTIAQASDLWLLNTQTGKLTHLPSFPILTYLKASGIAWTSDGHLIIAAAGGHRTAIAVWRPGQHTLSVRTIPALHGYAQMVPLTG